MPIIFDDAEAALEPIAIVGMSCRLPGSVDSSAKFWDAIRAKRSLRTPRVPASRFNIDAHYHPDLARPGSFSALGGYFLDEDPIDFDPTFFNMTPIEAQWLDPQQRKVLEVCYEVLENAGIPLEKAAGSNTGVYMATFTADYQQMSIFERDFRHNYAATGVDPGIISNRVNNVFNLAGPSCIINTACSSSVYAIHNACHALRAKDCDAAIAAGSNLVMIVDQHMNTAKLGVLSPTSECHTFDERADGYGRAEGVGALYLKRLSDAIRDGDAIRSVIRSSSVNTNGKVEGMGITYPNALGQEKVLRHAYARAKLDPSQTAYLECHGTGTPTGDPIEVRAVSLGMNDTRSRSKPLLLGAAKANIGHSEAASGIFAAMKATLMVEKGEIPGVCGFQKLNPKIKDKEWNVKIVENLMSWPAEFDVRRASVSSFGYGGTNAHLVIESVDSVHPTYEHGYSKAISKYSYRDPGRPLLVTMSAHNDKTLRANIAAHEEVAADYHLIDLAYTLNQRRTKFAARAFAVAESGKEADAFNRKNFSFGTKLSGRAEIGFVFTGQGAQWARMGYEAMHKLPSFGKTIDALESVLSRIEPRPAWSLREVLEDAADVSRVGQAAISQPACTAIQIAIVDLFESWGIEPAVTVGHSSGEIAAAYAAGRISAPEAIVAAYFRGFAVTKAAPIGTMLAVGLGAEEVMEYVNHLDAPVRNGLTIACHNSPGSVTISGFEQDILELKKVLDDASIFARQLKTGKAYHSPQMDVVAPLYAELYAKSVQRLDEDDLSWRRPLAGMVSSVTATEIESSELSMAYWCDNLRNPVLFNQAVTELGKTPLYDNVKILLEIGPHSALRGPIKQILQTNNYDMQYVASLERDTDGAVALLKTVGELFVRGQDIDFDLVNAVDYADPSGAIAKGHGGPRYLPDLPRYQWNYDKVHWYQPRAVKEQRESKHARHDILGRRIFGLSTNSSAWKNILRQRDVSWFADHQLGVEVVFPAAGHVSLAIEALLQQLDLEPEDAGAIRLQDISLQKALVIPDDDDGIEVVTRLDKQMGSQDGWYTFTVESVRDDSWTQHSTGRIEMRPKSTPTPAPTCPIEKSQLHQQAFGKQWYRSFNRVGFRYGSSFRTVNNVRANGKDRVALGGVKIQTTSPVMRNESRYVVHPSTIDGCLHVVIAAVHRGLHKEMPWGVMPVNIREMTIRLPSEKDLSTDGVCTAWAETAQGRDFSGKLQLFGSSGQCILDVHDWHFVTYDSAVPPKSSEATARQPYRQVTWQALESDDEPVEFAGKTAVFTESSSSQLANSFGKTEILLAELDTGLPVDAQAIVIDDAEGSVLTDSRLSQERWNHLQGILLSGLPVVWVTRGANSGRSADSGTPQGFLRTVRSERPSARITLVDADADVRSTHVAALVKQRLAAMTSSERASTDDVEFWLDTDRTVLVPRLQPNESLNELFHPSKEAEIAIMSADTAYTGAIEENQVVFEASRCAPAPLAPFEVEVQVCYAEISKDILAAKAMGQPTVVTGIVQRVGSGLDVQDLVGQPVAAFTRKTLTSRLAVTVFAKLPEHGLMESAAQSLPHIMRAVDATVAATGARKGDHVVLLPTEAPLFEQAVSRLGTHFGFQVSALSEKSNFDKTALLSNPNGRSIVIAAGPSPQIPEFWRSMPRGSTFILSDVPIESYKLDMRPLTQEVELRVRNVLQALLHHPLQLQSTLQTCVAMLPKLDLPTGRSLDASVLVDLAGARRALNETGATVVNFQYGKDQIKCRESRERTRFSADAIYLLVGCLGGIGRSLTTWMLEHGCKNFAFISRSGASKAEAADVVHRLEEAGANVDVFSADASDTKAVADIVATLSQQGIIKGVVHAAMVLEDGLFENMSASAFQKAMRPKVQAAKALDSALYENHLDFFIVTSSISGVLGNQGQANYAAANSYLDFLALERRRRGVAACSLALPMVEDVGVVAENAAIAEALARKMPFGINEIEMLQGFEAAVLQGKSKVDKNDLHLGDAQLVLGLEPAEMAVALDGFDISDSFWYNDARVSPVREQLEASMTTSGKSGSGGGSTSFVPTLQGLSDEEQQAAIAGHVMQRAARILGANAEDFQQDGMSIANHGIDSMIGVELQSWLFKEFDMHIGVQTLSHPNTTFAGLAASIAEGLKGETKESTRVDIKSFGA